MERLCSERFRSMAVSRPMTSSTKIVFSLVRNQRRKCFVCLFLLFVHSIEHVGKTTFATVLAIEMCGHEDTGSTFFAGTLAPQPMDLAVVVHTVVLQDRQLDLLVLVFDLLGGGVILLLAFLATTTQAEHQMKG
jgi:hypothetical protein